MCEMHPKPKGTEDTRIRVIIPSISSLCEMHPKPKGTEDLMMRL